MSVFVNGSPTPSVTGLSPGGLRGILLTSARIADTSGASCVRVPAGRPLFGCASSDSAACVWSARLGDGRP